MIGLLFIAIGTGGIKPCVSTFGGDQFSSDQVLLIIQTFFYCLTNLNKKATLLSN